MWRDARRHRMLSLCEEVIGNLENGYLRLGRVKGVPVRVHWTTPIGALIFGGFSPVFWFAFFVLVLLHEAGHAVLVRRYGHRVTAIDVTGFGGLCRWQGAATRDERAVIAWGGVAAQAVLLVITLGLVLAFGYPTFGPLRTLASAFISTNLFLIALNLLPFRPLDGAEAWPLVTRKLRKLGA